MRRISISVLLSYLLLASGGIYAQQRSEILLKDWAFHLGDCQGAQEVSIDDSSWQKVSVPHDWAITGPFDIENDLQRVAVTQDGEKVASLKTGRTGGLPYVGAGWYRTCFDTPADRAVEMVFDGAMSEARVYVNGKEACFWPYGYNSFHFDVTGLLNAPGESNVIAVRLENLPRSSRWYPGAGLYRNVHLVYTSKTAHVPVWGTYVTTPLVSLERATVKVDISLEGEQGKDVTYKTVILDAQGCEVAARVSRGVLNKGMSHCQRFEIENPRLWSPEQPYLYVAHTEIVVDSQVLDSYDSPFGIRSIEIRPDQGFFLNGKRRQFKGVCNHHDLGPLGAAINEYALAHQLELLKDMGCDAVRTSHNMPAPELVRLCDQMGLMMMVEPFDEWNDAKCTNGYHRYFDDWAEKDMVNMLHQFRNNPSVVMWSIGNEVPSQASPEGWKTALFLQDICHREDPTRPVTCGMDQVDKVLANGFATVLDVPGLNYRTYKYIEAYNALPQAAILGSETASTVSSRGVYHFPVEKGFSLLHPDHQSTGYDLEACSWSNIPDVDFALAEDYPWSMGQFVWTGFDYLGEPSPYSTDSWPSHSSVFGIIDLASLPKDRYYLYRSVWNTDEPTLHVLPHWTWPDREGKTTPVFVYTSYPEAELFVNGVSQGRRSKTAKASYPAQGLQDEALEGRYRLMWNDVVYHKGEIKVVAYDNDGKAVMEKTVRTAGKAYALKLERASRFDKAGCLEYLTVSVVDKNGVELPRATNEVKVSVSGEGRFKAMANGDPTCLELFHEPHMHLFSGKLTVIVERGEFSVDHAPMTVKISSKGLKSAQISL
ncbi:MAG: DUF4982 domain-containing protein [Bacteroidales bacterium]|nr:DUF4982 domain-containing protein [Bacteroidales bacterium]